MPGRGSSARPSPAAGLGQATQAGRLDAGAVAARLAAEPEPLIVVAHPDDEVIGAGAQLRRWPGARFVHVTDGAPRDLRDARAAGFIERAGYAQARRRELVTALARAGLRMPKLWELGFVDQEASFNLTELVRRLVAVLWETQPGVLLTHPYEGGHPDHDATALAVQQACRQWQHLGRQPPMVVEMTFYHSRAGAMVTGEFLPCAERAVATCELSQADRAFKGRLFECFSSQRLVLASFQLAHERFRVAPDYDFTRAPQAGRLFYEQFPWGVAGREWRRLARAALEQLEESRCV